MYSSQRPGYLVEIRRGDGDGGHRRGSRCVNAVSFGMQMQVPPKGFEVPPMCAVVHKAVPNPRPGNEACSARSCNLDGGVTARRDEARSERPGRVVVQMLGYTLLLHGLDDCSSSSLF